MSVALSWFLLEVSQSEDRRRERIRRNRLRRARWDGFDMPERDFIKAYRLSKELVWALIQDLSPLIKKERRNDALSIKTKILIALAFFGSGSDQKDIGGIIYHAVSQPAVSKAVRQVVNALNHPRIFKKYVVFPRSPGERDTIKQRFYQLFKIPGVIGCIDGTHIGIIKPVHHEERFYNRKGYHSLNVMIICDADLNIICMNPSYPGASHDSIVWQENSLNAYINEKYTNGETMHLLGDSGYPLRKTMMTPYLNAEAGTPEEHYYKKHVTARNVVERCIGVLKARFRCLLVARKLYYSPLASARIVNACTVLHNIANKARVPVPNDVSPLELQTERSLQYNEAENRYRHEADLNFANNRPRRANNADLAEGRAAQKALIHRLWIEAQHNL